MQLTVRVLEWEYRSVFRTAYKAKTHTKSVVAEVQDGAIVGRGEGIGVSYHGESSDRLVEQLMSIENDIRNGITRESLQTLLPPGGARNALDCALWDLESKRAGCRAWRLAGLSAVCTLETHFTLGLDSPEAMGRAAAAARDFSRLKIKLTGEDDLRRVELIHRARPEAELIVDANQSWSEQQLYEFTPKLMEYGVTLVEQPLPAGQDDALLNFKSMIPLCADESCQTTDSLDAIHSRYQYVNIKLDKTGGLTEALKLARTARQFGLKLMVGCMGGSSLSMAPAFVVGQCCDVVDLDSPLLTTSDVPHAIHYHGCKMSPPDARLWG